MMRSKLIFAVVALGFLLGFDILGCSRQRVTTTSYYSLKEVHLEKIGVLPFFIGRHPTNLRETMNCRLCRLSFDPANVSAGADSTLTHYVQQAMENRYEKQVVPQPEVRKAYGRIPKDEDNDTPMSLATRVGEAVEADHMVLGTVWKYKERVGSAAGTSSPASVAFDLYLVDVPSGKLLWTGSFDETQRSLSENVLDLKAFFSRGAKWLSANELAKYGTNEIIKEFPL